jgi:TfoX/Sxy family transcriptional regulator of competence genes
MAYDKDIEQSIQAICAAEVGLTSKHMFGGVCYLYRGNMAFWVYKDNLIVRLASHKEAKRQIDSGRALPSISPERP